MLDAIKQNKISQGFDELFEQAEQSDSYHVDAAKLEISERIYRVLEQAGVSKAELARRLGKSRAYVTKMLQGDVNFTIESLVRVARALGCKFDFQFTQQPASEHTMQLAEAWQDNLRASAFSRIGMQHMHQYRDIPRVRAMRSAKDRRENASVAIAA